MKSARLGPALILLLAISRLATAQPSYEFSAQEVDSATEGQLELLLAPMLRGPFAEPVQWERDRINHVQQIFDGVKQAFRSLPAGQERDTPELMLVLVHHRIPLASSSGGGKVVVSTGFLERYAPDDDQLAFIFGHEAAHAVCGHEREQLSAVWKRNAPQQLRAKDALQILLAEPDAQLQIAPLALVQERIADLVGLEVAALAGYDPDRALQFFGTARRLQTPGIYETVHDSPEARDAALKPLAALLKTPQTMKTLISCQL